MPNITFNLTALDLTQKFFIFIGLIILVIAVEDYRNTHDPFHVAKRLLTPKVLVPLLILAVIFFIFSGILAILNSLHLF
jgi:hypothetical protein